VELARRVGVQLLVGTIVALAIVYLPMAAAVNEAETARALAGITFGPSPLGGDPDASPALWKALFGGIGIAIVAAAYWSFAVRWRALIVVGVLSLVAGAVTADYARGITPFVVVGIALAAAMGLTVWHDRWLGGYIDDPVEPATDR
jgi:hypothetical protein